MTRKWKDSKVMKSVLFLLALVELSGVSGSFNLFIDKREQMRTRGLNSALYYVENGIVNQYAVGFDVLVQADVDQLYFSWQSLIKKPIHYEIGVEYDDLVALQQPIFNVSNVGRLPHKQPETFRISLPCSGKLTAEIEVLIRFTFSIKNPKPNATTINLKRTKICIEREESMVDLGEDRGGSEGTNPSGILFFQDPTPGLLLAGLLGGCAVTASIVFLTFFIYLRRKLVARPTTPDQTHPGDPNTSSTNSSPACLLRQPPPDSKWEKEKFLSHRHHTANPSLLSRSGSRNSYVTIASFWNDIFPSQERNKFGQQMPHNGTHNGTQNGSTFASTKGSDVSPYAYAHVGGGQILQKPPPPPLIEWYSQSPAHSHSSIQGHIYANNLYTFSPPPKPKIPSVAPPDLPPSEQILRQSEQIRQSDLQIARQSERSMDQNSTMRSGSESLIHLDGFQCRKNLMKESNVVERFL